MLRGQGRRTGEFRLEMCLTTEWAAYN